MMERETELKLLKAAAENIRNAKRALETLKDAGTIARIDPILKRLDERRAVLRSKEGS